LLNKGKGNMSDRILVVAAHPDDEVLGCGGTVARLIQEGYEAFTIILGEGVASRDEKRDKRKRAKEIAALRKEDEKANEFLCVKKVFFLDFPDNSFDSVPLIDIVKAVEKVKNKIKPDIIFTHYEKDLNIDHQLTYQAVITATRPLPGEVVKEIYSFEVLSATEWCYPMAFSPNVFFDIEDTIALKKKAMKAYKSELRDFPHPRSLKAIELNAKTWGMKVGMKYAEAFKLVRILK
jgi:LmbE family N-acetylglucosaminyl deacetylase